MSRGRAVEGPQTDTFRLTWRDASTSDRPGSLILDESQVLGTAPLDNTGERITWEESSAVVELPAGLHRLTLEAISNNGLANLDRFQLLSLTSAPGASAGDRGLVP